MLKDGKGANLELTHEEIEALFNDTPQNPPAEKTETNEPPATQPVDGDGNDPTSENVEKPTPENIETTKAFANRLREKTIAAINEEREAIAKRLGYTSYEDMQKKLEEKVLVDNGLDPEQVAPVVDQLVKQKLDNDPRLKELEAYRAKQVEEFGKRELEEITKLTDGEITSLNQLPRPVIELWKTKGSLKSAFLELEGEKLILKAKSAQSKGTTDHLKVPNGTTPNVVKQRPLTSEEKQVWKLFHPNISDEELNKKTINLN